MVKYFKELETPNEIYLNLIDPRNYNQLRNIEINDLKLDFFINNQELFKRIKEYNLLNDNNDLEKKIYNDYSNNYDVSIDWAYLYYANGIMPPNDTTGLSKNGFFKMCELERLYKQNHSEFDYDYFELLYFQFGFHDSIFKVQKQNVEHYLINSKYIAQKQSKLTEDDEKLFQKAFDEIDNYTIKLPKKEYENVKMYLPNSWYITPLNHLYNTMGKDGHKEANLIYPFNDIVHGEVYNPKEQIESINKILKEGYITNFEFSDYTNLIYDFISIMPEYYYDLDRLKKMSYKTLHKKSYNPNIVKLIIGIKSAHASLFSFFYHLKNNSLDYEQDIEYIKQFNLDEILVRCCGFHKVSSFIPKTITTSCINYEEEFKDYIEKGWTIDFVKPIIFDEQEKRVKEYNDDFLTIRKILKKEL